MASLDLIATARDDTFAARVAMLLMVSLVNVTNEAPDTPNHANRLALAQRHMLGAINSKSVAATAIASNATIQGEIIESPELLGANVPDQDLQFVLDGLVDSLANAYAAGLAPA